MLMMIMAESPHCCMFTCANSDSSISVLLAYKVDNYYFHFAIETQDSDVTNFPEVKKFSVPPGQSYFKAYIPNR